MITRIAAKKLAQLARSFKAVAIIGARQTGKTTLAKQVFPKKPYISLENLDVQKFAKEDTRSFLAAYPKGAILDEVQRVPEIFSYLQEILDNTTQKGMFILTGSNNFLLQQNIAQTLAGRIGYINLLPFSINELQQAKQLLSSDDDLMLKGFYPPIYHQKILPQDWMPNYIKTYIERDVRQIKNITDLLQFEKFVRLLAGRHGQELNSSSLSIDAGVDVKTIQSWLGILESSFIVYLLKPHFKNFNKTIVKRPKIHFYDSALVCWLLEITKAAQLQIHPQRGAIFEGMVITEMVKKRTNAGLPVNLYYWRDKTGNEIDIIVDDAGKLLPVEIKSGKTLHSEFTKSLHYYMGISKVKNACLLYGGDLLQKRSSGLLTQTWKNYFL